MTVGGACADGARRRWCVALLAVLLLAACTTPAAPAPAPPPPTAAPQPSQIVVAVDDLGAGFNPHLLAHQSPVTTALASLALPSVFRPDINGDLQLDKTVATSAQVTAQNPFTVTYELNLEASWTSNAPIAAEDFVYLWERMRDEPGVVDAAGYRLITDVRSRAAGKAVDVVFSQPYPAWKTLFSNLLPAHLLKDAPGSWTGALTNGLPASGGAFRVVSVDRARGEILLTRNDQYWDTPAVLDQLVLRRLGGTALVDGLGVGDVDIALPDPDETLRTALGGLAAAATDPDRARSRSSPSSPSAPTAARSPTPASARRSRASSTATPYAPPRPPTRWRPTPSRSPPRRTATRAPRPPAARTRPSLLTSAGWTRGRRRPVAGRGRAGAADHRGRRRAPGRRQGRRERRRPAEVGRDRHHGRRPHRRGAVRPGDRPAHPAEHQRHPDHALDVGHADAHPERRAHHRIGGDHHRRDHHRVTRPPRPPRASPSTSWSARAPSAATSPPTSRRTTAATTR